jgi:solute carrier family 1 (high affinity glutamate transporter) protein 1
MRISLHVQIFAGLAAGAALGLALPEAAPYLRPFGEVFKLGLLMIIAPLLLATMVTGVASLGDARHLGRLAAKTFCYIVATTSVAVLIGIVLVTAIRPGEAEDADLRAALLADVDRHARPGRAADDALWADLRAALRGTPEAPRYREESAQALLAAARASGPTDAAAAAAALRTRLDERPWRRRLQADRISARAPPGKAPDVEATRDVGDALMNLLRSALANPFKALADLNVLGIITFGLLLGGIFLTFGERARPAIVLCEILGEAMVKAVDLIMKIAPVGVMALIADEVAKSGLEVLKLLAVYVATVLAGLALHGIVVLPTFLWLVGGMTPRRFWRGFRDALAVAFSTSSSNATLPVSLECAERQLGVPARIARFVLPLGATLNMNGTALYEAVAAVFIAQFYGKDLTTAETATIVVLSVVAAIGTAGVPAASLVTLILVLQAVGLPQEGIGLLLAVDRILDMCRTTVNVQGDAIGAVIIARWSVPRPQGTEPG